MADPRNREESVELSEKADFRKGIEIVTNVAVPNDWIPPSASLDPPPASSAPEPSSGQSQE